MASFVRHHFTDLSFAWAPPLQQYAIKEPRLDGVCCLVTTKYLILSWARSVSPQFCFIYFSIPCSLPGLTSIFLPFSSSLFLSLSVSPPSLFQSLSKRIVSFEFYLKITTGNTCNGCKNNKKIPSLGGKLFNSEGGEEHQKKYQHERKKKDWKGITEFKKEEMLFSMIEERGYFIKDYWVFLF